MGLVFSAVHGFEEAGRDGPRSIDRDGNAHLADAARTVGADLVLMSVVGAAPDSPLELMRMKYAAERYLVASQVPSTIIRATAFEEFWVDLLKSTARSTGRPVVFGNGENPINFVSVHAVAALVRRVIADPTTRGKTLEIGGPADLTLNELAHSVTSEAGGGEPRHVPRGLLNLVAQTVGRVRPRLGRQVRGALAMDRIPVAFTDHVGHLPLSGSPHTYIT
jgi:NADH dehydrogenase